MKVKHPMGFLQLSAYLLILFCKSLFVHIYLIFLFFLGHNSRSNFVGVAQVWDWRFAPVYRILKWRNVVLLSRFGNYITYVSRTRSQTSSKRRFSAIQRRKAKGRSGIVKSAHARSWEAKTEIPPVKIKSTFPIWRYLHALQCQVHKWKEYDLS